MCTFTQKYQNWHTLFGGLTFSLEGLKHPKPMRGFVPGHNEPRLDSFLVDYIS